MKFFTGLQPTGNLHLGNYFGAIKPAIELQEKSKSFRDNFICIADLHSLTLDDVKKNKKLKSNSEELIKILYACGIDFEKSIVFTQSKVKQHTELYYILMCLTQMGELERMTQYKVKADNVKRENAGLFSYPVLMAADILLYDTDVVPVGKDQLQHLQLTRDIAERFNNKYGETFFFPKSHSADTINIKSLANPNIKMSKSDPNPDGCIYLLDTADTIRRKIKRAVTDNDNNLSFETGSEAVKNLLQIYQLLTNKYDGEIEGYFDNKYGVFKKELTDELVKFLEDIQIKYNRSPHLYTGEIEAAEAAEYKMMQVRQALNLI